MTLRALIVDDEPFARERVRRLLGDAPDIEVIGECPDGFRAVADITALGPDLVLLDVVMPGKDGFEVLDELRGAAPAVIFLTAHDRFAIRAFEAAALDYLLKPFDEQRFALALDRARRALGGSGRDRLRPVAFTPGGLTRLVVRHAGRIRFVKITEVSHITAEANYVCVHAGGEVHLVRETLGALEAELDPARFVRIHRATIVNLDRVRELEPMFNGQYAVVLDDGARVTLSRRYRPHLERRLGRPLP
jgi:two-component system, LytTR family, response regulator